MIRSRITTVLLILEFVFTGLLFVGTISHAISLNELGISRPQSLDIDFISESRGLDGSKYSQCTTDIFTLFNGQLGQQLKYLAVDTVNELITSAKDMAIQTAMCSLGNWVRTATGGFVDPPKCVKVLASDAKAELKAQLKQRLKSNFLVQCTGDTMRYIVTNTITDIIQTQGLDGGIAAATDWSYLQTRRPAEIAQKQWWTLLVNTDICPEFRDKVLNDLGVPQSYRDQPPLIDASGFRTDERAPFQLRASCTIPRNFDVTDANADQGGNSGWQYMELLDAPQNNWRKFERMALTEFEELKTARKAEAQTMLGGGGGGFTGTFGECARDPFGDCYNDGSMKLVPAAVRDAWKSSIEADFSTITNATGESGLLEDVAANIQVRLLDLANKPLPLKLELGSERNPANFTPDPAPSLSPGETGPNDSACTGGNPLCTCVKDNTDARSFASAALAPAISDVMKNNPLWFENNTSKIAGGVDYRSILQAVCTTLGTSLCHPHPNQDDEIVMSSEGIDTSFDVITGDGYVRTDGGSPVAACSEGVQ